MIDREHASEPRRPENEKVLPDSTAGLANLLGIEMDVMTAERVTATMSVMPEHHQPFGYLHGGASVVLAESVASVGAYLAAPEGCAAFGMEINANHLRSKRSGKLHAEGAPLHVGHTTQVWEIRIHDEEDRLVCVSRCTLAVVEARP